MDQSIVAHTGIQEATARSRTSLTSPGACGEQLFPLLPRPSCQQKLVVGLRLSPL